MKRLMIKLGITICLHIAINCTLIEWAFMFEGLPHNLCFWLELATIGFYQIPIWLTFFIKKLEKKSYKAIYCIVSIGLTLLTSWFWMIYVVGPLWLG